MTEREIIPKKLKDLTFCRVLPKSKRAFEKDWQLHQLNYSEIQNWVKDGNNYGIICSRKNKVGVIDADHKHYVKLVENLLPKTFSVKSSSDNKRHFYFKFKNFPEKTNKIILSNPDNPSNKGAQGGDIRMGEFYLVGPGSIHPDTGKQYEVHSDEEIAEIDFGEVIDLLSEYFRTDIISKVKNNEKFKLSIIDVLNHYGIELKGRGPEYFTEHPIHGSEGGSNFGVNVEKNVWICRRHNTGGSVVKLIAMLEDLVNCEDLSKKLLPEVREKVNAIIQEKFGIDFTVSWDVTQDGSLKGTYNNCLNFLEEKKADIKLNLHSGIIDFEGQRYEDDHKLIIKERMREIKLEPQITIINEAIKTYSKNNEYNPVIDYLESLKWDGKNRCTTWLQAVCGVEDNDYFRFVSRTIVLAPVYRAFEPGCQYHYMPILEGKQGVGKSSLVKALGGEFYKNISLMERDNTTIQLMRGGWIIEVPELAVFAKRDIESLKSFISNDVDFARFVYQQEDKVFPRKSTFIGTINPGSNGYLMDETGNRRFLPVEINKVDFELFYKFRDQLFAEAVELYKSGIPIYVEDDPELEEEVKMQQKKREEHDDWAELIINNYNRMSPDLSDKMSGIDIYQRLIGGQADKYDQKIARRIGKIMLNLGSGRANLEKINGQTARYFDMSVISKSKVF